MAPERCTSTAGLRFCLGNELFQGAIRAEVREVGEIEVAALEEPQGESPVGMLHAEPAAH